MSCAPNVASVSGLFILDNNICTEIHENIKTVDKNYCINICTEIYENIKTVEKNYCINICTEIHEDIKTVDKTIV